jgi:acetyl esterase
MSDAPTRSERSLRRLLDTLLALPERVQRTIRGPDRTNDRGDRLEPDLQLMVRLESLKPQDLVNRTPLQARANLVGSIRIVEGAARALARTEDHVVDGVRVRAYVPRSPGPLPILVYLHGGGWVVGDLRSHDRFCRRLAAEGDQVVVAVDYPLAPECPYPAGLGVAVDVVRWIRKNAALFHGDADRVAVGGDSAGGNLAAAACLRLRDLGEPLPVFQLLIYPALDLRCLTASYRALGEGYLLTKDSIQWYLGHYGAEVTDPRASVLLEPELRGLPPAIVVTAGFDPLRDDGEQYVVRLREAGVEVTALPFPGQVHGFVNMDGAIPSADRATGAVLDVVRRRWADGVVADRVSNVAVGEG